MYSTSGTPHITTMAPHALAQATHRPTFSYSRTPRWPNAPHTHGARCRTHLVTRTNTAQNHCQRLTERARRRKNDVATAPACARRAHERHASEHDRRGFQRAPSPLMAWDIGKYIKPAKKPPLTPVGKGGGRRDPLEWRAGNVDASERGENPIDER